MNLNTSKISAAFLLAIFRFAFVIFPLKMNNLMNLSNEDEIAKYFDEKRTAKFKNVMILFYAFGAGVMLFTCSVHLTPEVHEKMRQLFPLKNYAYTCSVSQLSKCAGFFFMYFVDDIVRWIITKIPSKPLNDKFNDIFFIKNNTSTVNLGGALPGFSGNSELVVNFPLNKKEIVLIALSNTRIALHALFEGLAVGLQTNNSGNIWFLVIALMIHTVTTLFFVGNNFIVARAREPVVIGHFFIQALASPLGISIGYVILITNIFGNDGMWLNAYLQAISAGTLFYITFFEALTREKRLRILRFKRGMSMMLGFLIMYGLEMTIFDNYSQSIMM